MARPPRRARLTLGFEDARERFQNPAGQSATTALAPPCRAHSTAVQPPSEIPATAGLPSMPSESKKSSDAVARFAARGSTPFGSSGDSPNPGMSTATTSCSAASRSITGDHWISDPPSEWSSSRGGPSPART